MAFTHFQYLHTFSKLAPTLPCVTVVKKLLHCLFLSSGIFTNQVIALLLLYNALTTYEAQTGEMQINKLDQPP